MQRVHGYETNTEFWRYGEEVETISRQYLELRYRLLPYIYQHGRRDIANRRADDASAGVRLRA